MKEDLKTNGPWTLFWDMYSGGGIKVPHYGLILIPQPEDVAVETFRSMFFWDPCRTTCSCCGPDYSITEHTDLFQATGFHRNCDVDKATDRYIEAQGTSFSSVPYEHLEEYLEKNAVYLANGVIGIKSV